jgi:transmembrane sensor
MMKHSNSDEAVIDEALAWRASLDNDDADWDGYIRWLEADPRHRAIYDELDLVDAAVLDHREDIGRLLRSAPRKRRLGIRGRRMAGIAGSGIAAALALFFMLPAWNSTTPRSYEAGGGAERLVVLAEGVRVTLSPSSRIVVSGEATDIELTKGEAFFDVRHDPARTLVVSAGDYNISDIGTRFSVNLGGEAFRIGVSQGTVAVSSDRTSPINVTAGEQLVSAAGGLTRSPIAVTEVGSWRSGRLSYSNAPLSLVTADISRYSGRRVSIDPSLENAHFSGSLVIGNGSRLLSDLAAVMGASVRHEDDGDRIGVDGR